MRRKGERTRRKEGEKEPEKAAIYVSRTRENNKKYKGECSGVYFLWWGEKKGLCKGTSSADLSIHRRGWEDRTI